jgi:hypothetical protein
VAGRAFARCPPPPQRSWDLPAVGAGSKFATVTLAELEAVDLSWDRDRRSTDTHGWKWADVLLRTSDCIYSLGSPTLPIAALFGARGKLVTLPSGAARRLNYFQIDPTLRGTGFARAAMAAFARFALDTSATQLLIGSLPDAKVQAFYLSLGAEARAVPGWTAPPGVVPILVSVVTLNELGDRADALEETIHT